MFGWLCQINSTVRLMMCDQEVHPLIAQCIETDQNSTEIECAVCVTNAIKASCSNWHKDFEFMEGREKVENDNHGHRP